MVGPARFAASRRIPPVGERSPVVCQVRMLNEYPLLPDFERLGEMISEETRA